MSPVNHRGLHQGYGASELLIEPLFLNDKFKINSNNNKVFHFKEWTSKNIFFVKDLLKEDGKFLNFQEINQKHDIRVIFLSIWDIVML